MLRKVIRQIILEDRQSFLNDILANPNWDEGAKDDEDEYLKQKQKYDRARFRGREVKKAFHKHADRNFIDSLVYIYWSHYGNKLFNLIKDSNALQKPCKDEITCEAYLPGYIREITGVFGSLGLIIKGHVSLLGNEMDNMVSGYSVPLKHYSQEQNKTSGLSRGVQVADAWTYALDKESFNKTALGNEAFLDNWQPIGIVTLKKGSKKGETYGPDGIGDGFWKEAEKLQKSVFELTGIKLPIYHLTDLNNIKL